MTKPRRKHESAEYWEGWQAVQTRQPCRYAETALLQRIEWAKGFASAVDEGRASKVWYRSRSFMVAASLVLVGVGMVLYGRFFSPDNGSVLMASGSGLSIGNAVSMFLRTLTSEPISFTGGGGSQSGYYGNP